MVDSCCIFRFAWRERFFEQQFLSDQSARPGISRNREKYLSTRLEPWSCSGTLQSTLILKSVCNYAIINALVHDCGSEVCDAGSSRLEQWHHCNLTEVALCLQVWEFQTSFSQYNGFPGSMLFFRARSRVFGFTFWFKNIFHKPALGNMQELTRNYSSE